MIDSNIPLMGRPGELNIGQTANALINLQGANLQHQAMKQSMEQNALFAPMKAKLLEQQLAKGALQNEGAQFELDNAKGLDLYRMATGLKQIQDPQARMTILGGLAPKLLEMGMPEANLMDGLDDKELDMAISALSRYAPAQQNDYFAPVAALDEQGNPVFVQGSRDGGINPIKGYTPMKTTDQEASKIRIKEAQEKAKIDVEKDINKLSGTAKEERILSVIDTGIAAAEVVPTYDRMLELIDSVDTGGVQSGLQRAKQLFGWGAADIGELDALFKEAVLSNLRKMGANPTEGERQFLLESSGSITQSPAVLKRLISRRRDQSKNAVEKGKKWASERGDTEALELMGMQSQPAEINEDEAALQWAQSNPNDPRAQQILQMMGGQ